MRNSRMVLTDDAFLLQFEQCTLPKEDLKHVGHLRVAWLYMVSYPFDEASKRIIMGIKRYAASLGALHIYHETQTRAWIYLVHYRMQRHPHSSFHDFLSANPDLLNPQLLQSYYSAETFHSEQARSQWVEPDLKPNLYQ
jgi:hypothetical protein